MKSKVYTAGFIYLLTIFVVMYAIPCLASVTGTVKDTSGSPVSGALITFTDESKADKEYSDYTDSDGKYDVLIYSVHVEEESPAGFQLQQNYPNPFNPSTTIPFTLDSSGHVTLTVFNVMGQRVQTLIDSEMHPGAHFLTWNGRDEHGNSVAAGIYFYQLRSDGYNQTRKMLLLDGGNSFQNNGLTKAKISIQSYNQKSGIVSKESAHKISSDNEYSVVISGQDIFPFELTGILLSDDSARNFVVSRIQSKEILNLSANESGNIQLENGANITIPVDTFDSDLIVTVQASDDVPPEMEMVDIPLISDIYEFDAEDVPLKQFVGLSIPYDPSKLPAGAQEKDIFPVYWTGEHWIAAKGTVDTDSKMVHVETNHLSLWGNAYSIKPELTLKTNPEVYDNTYKGDALEVQVIVDPKYEDISNYDVTVRFFITNHPDVIISSNVALDTLVPVILTDNGGIGGAVFITHNILGLDYKEYRAESYDTTPAGDNIFGARLPSLNNWQELNFITHIELIAIISPKDNDKILFEERTTVQVIRGNNEERYYMHVELDKPEALEVVGHYPVFSWHASTVKDLYGDVEIKYMEPSRVVLYVDNDSNPFSDFWGGFQKEIEINVSGMEDSFIYQEYIEPGDYWWGIKAWGYDKEGNKICNENAIAKKFIVNGSSYARIYSPENMDVYTQGDEISFSGRIFGDDAVGIWTSDIDGELSRLASFSKNDLSLGTHTITLNVHNLEGPGSISKDQCILTVKKTSVVTDQERVVFISKRDGNREVYIVNLDGTNLINLSQTTLDESGVFWSPDGSKISFVSKGDAGEYKLNIVNPDGSSKLFLSKLYRYYYYSWSPDGNKIAFFDDKREFYIANSDGSNFINITNKNYIFDPCYVCYSWSPDGNKIILNARKENNWGLFLFNFDGSGEQKVATFGEFPLWSPNGLKISYIWYEKDKNPSVRVADAENFNNYTEIYNNCNYNISWIKWSPDGTKLGISCETEFNRYRGPYIANVDGSNLVNLSDNGFTMFEWSPKGDKIAFALNNEQGSNLYVSNSDGDNFKKIASEVWPYEFRWSPDGFKIVYTGNDSDIYVINYDGTDKRNITNNTYSGNPYWSLSGDKIIFHSSEDNDVDIYCVNIDGSGKINLSNSTADDYIYFDDIYSSTPVYKYQKISR